MLTQAYAQARTLATPPDTLDVLARALAAANRPLKGWEALLADEAARRRLLDATPLDSQAQSRFDRACRLYRQLVGRGTR